MVWEPLEHHLYRDRHHDRERETWFSNLWTHLQNVWNGICNVVQTAVMLLGSIIQGAVDIIRFIWENCKDIVTSRLERD